MASCTVCGVCGDCAETSRHIAEKPSFVTDLDIHACRNSQQLSSKMGSTVMKVPGSIE